MLDVTWTHPALPLILVKIPKEVKSLVDVGCGRGIIGALCRIYREPIRLVGIDAYEPYLEFCKRYKFYDELIQWNLEKLPLPFKDKEFEVATCIEVIEHLSKDGGEGLLNELERISNRVIITTPNLFFKQTEYDKNTYQKHISLWGVGDFRRRNYKVYGVGGMKVFGRTVRWICTALGPMTKYMPSLSSMLLGIKDNVKDAIHNPHY
jgi:SAM-dependent methyltransferase